MESKSYIKNHGVPHWNLHIVYCYKLNIRSKDISFSHKENFFYKAGCSFRFLPSTFVQPVIVFKVNIGPVQVSGTSSSVQMKPQPIDFFGLESNVGCDESILILGMKQFYLYVLLDGWDSCIFIFGWRNMDGMINYFINYNHNRVTHLTPPSPLNLLGEPPIPSAEKHVRSPRHPVILLGHLHLRPTSLDIASAPPVER